MHMNYFGTDSVRGRVGEHPITPQFFMHLGYAAGKAFAGVAAECREHPSVLIGKDTRISGYMLESALQAGLIAAGVDVYLVGPLPTPAVAYLTRALRLQAGIMISASHNPYEYNGIKFFSENGTKLPDEIERAIETVLEQPMYTNPSERLGKARRIDDAVGRYIEFCKSTFPHDQNLNGTKIVVDSANGAAYHIAHHVFRELGADVVVIGAQPDGRNINDGYGTSSPQNLQKEVIEQQADIGIALDGDGDRLVMSDSSGRLYVGDQLLYVIAKHRQLCGKLQGGVVGTLMTNLAFEQAMQRLAIPFQRADIGDRSVKEMLLKLGWRLGGESSGHIICMDKHSTGDGIVSALQVLYAMRSNRQSLDILAGDLSLYPQVLINVRVIKGVDYLNHDRVKEVVSDVDRLLSGKGRVLLHLSGTGPVLHVMVEGNDVQMIEFSAQRIVEVIHKLEAGHVLTCKPPLISATLY